MLQKVVNSADAVAAGVWYVYRMQKVAYLATYTTHPQQFTL